MHNQNQIIASVMRRAESKFGFRFACELHQALRTLATGHRAMLRKALA
jgi:hypothetical protein